MWPIIKSPINATALSAVASDEKQESPAKYDLVQKLPSEYAEYFYSMKMIAYDIRKPQLTIPPRTNAILYKYNDQETGRLRYRLDGQAESLFAEYYENFTIFEPVYTPKVKVKKVNPDPYGRYAKMDAPRSTEDMKPEELAIWNRYLENLRVTKCQNTPDITPGTSQI